MAEHDHVREWVQRLWLIDSERQSLALERLRSWGVPHVVDKLGSDSADGVLGAVFLVESFDALVERGVAPQKLIAKLRGDPDLWPTWAEIRAGGLLVRHSPDDIEITSEPGRKAGRQPDYGIKYASGESISIEFKAIGLSDQEAAFTQRVSPILPHLVPRHGICTVHVQDTDTEVRLNRETRRKHLLQAERLAKNLPPVARPIAAAVIVGHGTSESYTRRLANRFQEAFAQLPPGSNSWIAFHWSNGAPTDMIRRSLARTDPPDHLDGVMLLGTVVIPGSIDNYSLIIPKPFDTTSGETEWNTDVTVEHAQGIFNRVNESGGVRPTLMRVPSNGRQRDFLHRGGEQRIFPFNLVLAPDPPDLLPPRDPLARER
jgi:hypothetical protein